MALTNRTKKWLNKNHAPDLSGKTVIITGANSGVGYKSAEIALYLGAKVIMACRNADKAEAAKAKLRAEYPGAGITVMTLDLADFDSVDAFAAQLQQEKTDIDVFLNNAGVFRKPGKTTAQGFELVMGTNYLGVYRLSEKVLPYLKTLPHKVLYINTVSLIHKAAKTDYGDFFCQRHYGSFKIYARSKLYLARYTYCIAKKYENSNVRILMSHPGIAITPLGINAFGKTVGHAAKAVSVLFNSPEKSALALPFIIANGLPAGSIAGPKKLFGGWGYPKVNRVLKRVKTGGEQLAAKTLEITEKPSHET
ncbi:MAG: SDR family NAD(P)-dependent oxidoreductase [Clostridia bacterium]|nr:SDR family NAD(P)-dependent oxidoreductase [Clostridia bacterium]